ncbi:DUF397 domain-containing protein [Actinacidiphila oryziradicis]|uniref:DUF397 domain-containing protein n=1 Tax=Actinacidiphila oryziradicis TaxID=2571141 RepID=A0A4U0STX9_9ACTN|nr:DUF397 domain-containing protein [Actinacidiphila oryziradicis]TKA12963.1 DUF397 domain-containing protein [Actinacidiphila oryziradicis]
MTLKPSARAGSALEWFKSSYSTDDGPSCVEIATAPGAVHVRDSKDPQGPQFAFTSQAWAEFVSYAAKG